MHPDAMEAEAQTRHTGRDAEAQLNIGAPCLRGREKTHRVKGEKTAVQTDAIEAEAQTRRSLAVSAASLHPSARAEKQRHGPTSKKRVKGEKRQLCRGKAQTRRTGRDVGAAKHRSTLSKTRKEDMEIGRKDSCIER